MKPARFSYVAPTSLAEVHDALQVFGEDGKLLAGGQSLGPLLNLRLASPRGLIDLAGVQPLAAGITEEPDHLWVPAMTRHRTLETDRTTARVTPLLSQALPHVAHRTIRNRGTIGGSLSHADPAAELPAVAVAADAVVIAESRGTRRRIAASDLFAGFFTTTLDATEVIVGVEFPKTPVGSGTGWVEFAPRRGDYAIVGVAARVDVDAAGQVGTARIVCAGVADVPWRSTAAEAALIGAVPSAELLSAVADVAADEASPPTDSNGSSAYRKDLVRQLTKRAATQAVHNAKES